MIKCFSLRRGLRRGRLGRRVLAVVAAAAISSAAPMAVRADVTAEGDVSPTDLPLAGGTASADVIVGGAGLPTVPFPIGRLTIDIPAFTDPLISPNGYIANTSDSIGIVQIDGLFSEWDVQQILSVGRLGQGYLDITNGAIVRTLGGVSGDADLLIGDQGDFPAVLPSQGYVTVSGLGSLLRSSNVSVGHFGFGRVAVSNRARLDTLLDAFVGDESRTDGTQGQGEVSIDGQGSRWTIGDDLFLGQEGLGLVTVSNRGQVLVGGDVTLSEQANSFGKLVVTGQGSLLWATDGTALFRVGATTNFARGEVHIDDFGEVRAEMPMTIVDDSFVELSGSGVLRSAGTITNGGLIRGDGFIEAAVVNNGYIRNAALTANLREKLWFTHAITNNDNIESEGGEMEFQGLVTNNGPNGDIFGKDAIFRFNGGYTGSGNLFLDNTVVWSSSTVNVAAGGLVSVAASSASHMIGDFTLQNGALFDVTLGPHASRLEVGGNVNVDGAAILSLADGYIPSPGDAFEILTGTTLSGAFDFILQPINSFGVTWVADYSSGNSVILRAGSGNPADQNGDGVVSGADLALILGNFGGTPPPGDANGDGVVDGADIIFWQRNQNSALPAVPAFGVVPEPASGALLALAGIALAARRRKMA